MILKQFPDIDLVRSLRNDASGQGSSWMNVALHLKCRQASRTGVESPYSLFINKAGDSYCNVNGHSYTIGTDTFLFVQPGDTYDLTIDNLQQTEICNIHISKQFFEGCAQAYLTASEKLLDEEPSDDGLLPFLFTQQLLKDERMNKIVNRIAAQDPADITAFELALTDAILYLLQSNDEARRKMCSLPFMRPAVKEDIYRRLKRACDYMYSNYQLPLEIDVLSREARMSKFHFLRMFKCCYAVTPYQYLAQVRMHKAATLLKTTKEPVAAISDALGFEYVNSFIKAFRKHHGSSPLQYRLR